MRTSSLQLRPPAFFDFQDHCTSLNPEADPVLGRNKDVLKSRKLAARLRQADRDASSSRMVNVGGPSKGCLTCIRRKIKCDKERPTCGQCERSRRQCGGYRDTTVTMFRDQSDEVTARLQAEGSGRNPKKAEISPTAKSSSSVAAQSSSSNAITPPILIQSLALDQEDGWIDFFIINFACHGTTDSKSNLFWIPPNFDQMLQYDCAKFSAQAVGAIALARLKRSPSCLQEAQKKYSLALIKLAEVWGHISTNAEKDVIFLIVLFLSFFEVLSKYEESSRKSWITHLGGLGVLFKSNEDYYASTEFGVRMFFHARSQVILVALQTKTPVADAFSRPNPRVMRSAPRQFRDIDESDQLLIRLANLQFRYRISGPSRPLLLELVALETSFRLWTNSLPEAWGFCIRQNSRPSGLWWDMYQHTYAGPIQEGTRNKVRAAQIIIHDLIQNMMKQLDPEDSDHKAIQEDNAVSANVRQLVIDSCSTIHPCFRPLSTPADLEAAGPPPRMGATYWMILILDVIGSMHEATPELTNWIIQVFELIHEKCGNVRAHVVANKLRRGQKSFSAESGYPDLLNMKT